MQRPGWPGIPRVGYRALGSPEPPLGGEGTPQPAMQGCEGSCRLSHPPEKRGRLFPASVSLGRAGGGGGGGDGGGQRAGPQGRGLPWADWVGGGVPSCRGGPTSQWGASTLCTVKPTAGPLLQASRAPLPGSGAPHLQCCPEPTTKPPSPIMRGSGPMSPVPGARGTLALSPVSCQSLPFPTPLRTGTLDSRGPRHGGVALQGVRLPFQTLPLRGQVGTGCALWLGPPEAALPAPPLGLWPVPRPPCGVQRGGQVPGLPSAGPLPAAPSVRPARGRLGVSRRQDCCQDGSCPRR